MISITLGATSANHHSNPYYIDDDAYDLHKWEKQFGHIDEGYSHYNKSNNHSTIWEKIKPAESNDSYW